VSDTTLELTFEASSREAPAEIRTARPTAVRSGSAERKRLFAACGLSMLFWAAVLFALRVIPPLSAPPEGADRIVTEIEISLAPSSASRTAPAPIAPAEPVRPVAAARPPVAAAKPAAVKPIAAPAPEPIAEPEPLEQSAPADAAPVSAPVLQPIAEAGPAIAGEPVPSAPAGSSESESQSTAAEPVAASPSTMALLNAAIKRNLKYPPQARKRNIEGKVEIALSVASDGALAECALAESSGSGILDEAALRLLRRLFPLSGAAGGAFSTRVAIEYRLK